LGRLARAGATGPRERDLTRGFSGRIEVDQRDSTRDWEPYVDLEMAALAMMKRE